MKQIIGIHEAKTNFSQLVKQAVAGNTILIGGYGKAEVALVALNQTPVTRKKIGVLAGLLIVPDDFDAPLPTAILAAFEGGA